MLGASALLFNLCAYGADERTLNEAAILEAVNQVVADYGTILTCLALDERSHKVLLDSWPEVVVRPAAQALRALEPSAQLAARFAAAVEPSRLQGKDMPLSQAMALCHDKKSQELVRGVEIFQLPDLAEAITRAANTP